MAITASNSTETWVALAITLPAATICFALRLMSRRLNKLPLWWDDYAAIAGYFCAILWFIQMVVWIHYGFGTHLYEVEVLPFDQLLMINKIILYTGEILYGFAMYFAKTSILCFYLRLFGKSNIRLTIQILLGCAVVWIIFRTVMGIFHCIPVNSYWDPSVEGFCMIGDMPLLFGTISVHVIMDSIIIALPIVPIRKLNLPLKQRIGVAVMFMFGIFVCIGSIMIMVVATKYDAHSTDLSWNMSQIMTWVGVEVNMVVLSANLPTIRPAVLFLMGRRASDHSGDSSNKTGGASSAYNTTVTSRSQAARGIKLADRLNPQKGLSDIEDDAGSTYQLADSVHDNSSGDFENHALDRTNFRTVIAHNHQGIGNPDNAPFSSTHNRDGKIVVKSETSVRVDPYQRKN